MSEKEVGLFDALKNVKDLLVDYIDNKGAIVNLVNKLNNGIKENLYNTGNKEEDIKTDKDRDKIEDFCNKYGRFPTYSEMIELFNTSENLDIKPKKSVVKCGGLPTKYDRDKERLIELVTSFIFDITDIKKRGNVNIPYYSTITTFCEQLLAELMYKLEPNNTLYIGKHGPNLYK